MNVPIYATSTPTIYTYSQQAWSSSTISGISGAIYDFAVHNNTIYISTNIEIFELEASGGSYNGKLILEYSDIDIKGDMSVKDVKSFAFSKSSDILFYDSSSQSIRKISLN